MINLKPTFSQLAGPVRHGRRYQAPWRDAWSFVEWLSKDGAAGYRREETFTLLTPKIILNQWVDAMSEGSTSDCMLLIEECVQGSLVAGFPAKVFYLGLSSVVVRHPVGVDSASFATVACHRSRNWNRSLRSGSSALGSRGTNGAEGKLRRMASGRQQVADAEWLIAKPTDPPKLGR